MACTQCPLTVGFGLGMTLALMTGCGEDYYALAPVSGKVTVDGEPLEAAYVGFQPIGGDLENPIGPGSYGHTDANGRFVLQTMNDDTPGAVVGTHRVSIFAGNKGSEVILTEEDAKGSAEREFERLRASRKQRKLAKRFRNSSLRFVVPREGSDTADFAVEWE